MKQTRRAQSLVKTCASDIREYHLDKTRVTNDTVMQELSTAKEQCLEQIKHQDHALSELDFAQHICRVLDMRLKSNGITGINLGQGRGAHIVGCKLR